VPALSKGRNSRTLRIPLITASADYAAWWSSSVSMRDRSSSTYPSREVAPASVTKDVQGRRLWIDFTDPVERWLKALDIRVHRTFERAPVHPASL
jgi:hypothetical protein